MYVGQTQFLIAFAVDGGQTRSGPFVTLGVRLPSLCHRAGLAVKGAETRCRAELKDADV